MPNSTSIPRYSVIVPHYQTGKMTAYCLAKLLKYSVQRLDIIVVNNSPSHPDNVFLRPFQREVTILPYPSDRIQSHAIAIDYALPHINTPYFIVVETDSFPTQPDWLSYYDRLVDAGVDAAGSVLALSGGTFLHPAGALYKTATCREALQQCLKSDYTYFPNASVRHNFAYHLMVHHRVLAAFCADPETFNIVLHRDYVGLLPEQRMQRAIDYKPVDGLFHCGKGRRDDVVGNHGQRTLASESEVVVEDGILDIIHRVGYEPGQFLCYWLVAHNRTLFPIPTETVWMPNRTGQQQEYTMTEHGFKHLWGMTAYHGCTVPELQDIVIAKEQLMNSLYASLPDDVRV